jgi:hypothetical protein
MTFRLRGPLNADGRGRRIILALALCALMVASWWDGWGRWDRWSRSDSRVGYVVFGAFVLYFFLHTLLIFSKYWTNRKVGPHQVDKATRPLVAKVGIASVALTIIAAINFSGRSFSVQHILQLLLLSVLGFVLLDRSSWSLSRGADSRGMLSLTLALATFEALRWDFFSFVDAALPLITLLGATVFFYILMITRKLTVLSRIGGEASLKAVPSEGLEQLQTDLIRAEEVLRTLRDESRALDQQVASGSITSREKLRRERILQEHVLEVRSIPPILADEDVPPASRWKRFRSLTLVSLLIGRTAGSRSARTLQEAAGGKQLPSSLSPIDVALAFGPKLSAAENAVRALRTVISLALLPASYFIWARLLGEPSGELNGTIGIEVLLSEFAFWMGYGLCFGLLWSTLPGRRGSTKALLFWLSYLFVVGLLWLTAHVAGEPLTQGLLLRGLVLVVLLLKEVRSFQRHGHCSP